MQHVTDNTLIITPTRSLSLDRIANTTYVDATVTDREAWSAVSVCWSVCLSHWWALQKQLNRSIRRLDWGLGWAWGTMY